MVYFENGKQASKQLIKSCTSHKSHLKRKTQAQMVRAARRRPKMIAPMQIGPQSTYSRVITLELESSEWTHSLHTPGPPGSRTSLVHICSDPLWPHHCHGTSAGRGSSRSCWPRNTRGQART